MEVDWDEIDKNYLEVPSSIGFKLSSCSPNISDDTTICVNGSSTLCNISPSRIQQGSKFQRPNAIDENEIPDTTIYRIQKPDGGV